MGRYFSDELFHFVGLRDPQNDERNYSILKKILSEGCITHPGPDALTNAGWGVTSVAVDWSKTLVSTSQELIVPTVICLADIPLEHLEVHVTKYGAFGLALSKAQFLKHGARPVTYIPISITDKGSAYGKELLRNIEQTYRGFHEHVAGPLRKRRRSIMHVIGSKPASPEDAIIGLDSIVAKDFLAFIKVYDSALPPDHPECYYAEREWRKYANQRFQPSDVLRIVVRKSYAQRLCREMPTFAGVHMVEL